MYRSVFVNRLKIPRCCSSEAPGVQRGWEGSRGQAAAGEQAQASHVGTEPRDGPLRLCRNWGWLEDTVLVSGESVVPGRHGLVVIVREYGRWDLESPRAQCGSGEQTGVVGLLTKLSFGSAPLLKGNYSLFCITACTGFRGAGTSILQNTAFSRRCRPQSTRGDTSLKGALSEACVSVSSGF